MRRFAALASAAFMLTACGAKDVTQAAAPPAAPGEILMDSATQAKMGVKTATIQTSATPQIVSGFARVMDIGALAAIDAEISASESAAAASQAEYQRLSALADADQAASKRAVEAARAQAFADSSRAGLASRRIGLEWGTGLAKMPRGARAALLNEIANGGAALVRVDAPALKGDVKSIDLLPVKDVRLKTTILGAAGPVDPKLQTAGLLAVARGRLSDSLPAGRTLRAELILASDGQGYVLPSSALIRANGTLWAYVQTGDGKFRKREVQRARAFDGGWIVPGGFNSGEVIVTDGAGSLYAAETGPIAVQ